MRRWTQPPRWLDWPSVIWLRNPYVQMRLGVVLIAVTTLAWIASQIHNAMGGSEPPTVLALSWLAVWLTGLTLVLLTDVGEVTKDD